jgi:Na+/proline symporter
LLIAAIYLAFFLILVKRLFKEDYLHLFALNGLFVLWLSSAAFSTTFFSGGWILVLFLYFIFQPFFKDLTTTKDARENSK